MFRYSALFAAALSAASLPALAEEPKELPRVPTTDSTAVVLDETFQKPAGNIISVCTSDNGVRLTGEFFFVADKNAIVASIQADPTEHFEAVKRAVARTTTAFQLAITDMTSQEMRSRDSYTILMNGTLSHIRNMEPDDIESEASSLVVDVTFRPIKMQGPRTNRCAEERPAFTKV